MSASIRFFFSSSRSLAAAAAVLGIALTGCGKLSNRYVARAPSSSYNVSSSSYTVATNSDYACPDSPNVVPDYDQLHDGSGYFTVCPSRAQKSDVLVHGEIAAGSQVCIFPAQVIDDAHIYVKPDLQTGLPWVQCTDVAETGIYGSFPGINWNAAFIVSNLEKDQMRSCLATGNYYACPSYSFGRFR